jgi:hypothetical protein
MLQPAGSGLARELQHGATVWGPRGEDLTAATQTAFRAALPACGGDKGAAAMRAVNAALAGQRREERP